jgi:hypothetical protein
MDLDTFLSLPTKEVAQIVGEAGPKVCVFPINGTRRWFMLEYPELVTEGLTQSYLDITGKRYIEVYQLFFDHGIRTLLTPIFGPDLLERGEAYTRIVTDGMARLVTHPDFLTFYQNYKVRVRFYGDYHKFLDPTSYSELADLFDEKIAKRQSHDQYLLLFGVFAHDATETVAELSVDYYTHYHRLPDKDKLIELYYGEYVAPVDLFIGFDKFSAFDMPLVATGSEDLYFTVAPSLYMTERQLRCILYDHLYVRKEKETDYSALTSEDWQVMRDFYDANRDKTLGVGARQKSGRFWYPLPQVDLPDSMIL